MASGTLSLKTNMDKADDGLLEQLGTRAGPAPPEAAVLTVRSLCRLLSAAADAPSTPARGARGPA